MANFYEFFAGGGMARAGLGPDWQCLLANDFDPKKAASYAANWGDDHLRVGDVAALTTADLPAGADLAWASFPCQDLSLAGARAFRSARDFPFTNLGTSRWQAGDGPAYRAAALDALRALARVLEQCPTGGPHDLAEAAKQTKAYDPIAPFQVTVCPSSGRPTHIIWAGHSAAWPDLTWASNQAKFWPGMTIQGLAALYAYAGGGAAPDAGLGELVDNITKLAAMLPLVGRLEAVAQAAFAAAFARSIKNGEAISSVACATVEGITIEFQLASQ